MDAAASESDNREIINIFHSDGEGTSFEKNVLIAVDVSEHSVRAFQAYVDNIHQPRNKVIVLNVFEPAALNPVSGFGASNMWRFDSWSIESEQAWRLAHDKHVQASKHLQQEYGNRMKEFGLHGKVSLLKSHHTGHAIVEYANEENVAFIVMGSRGHGKMRKTFLGCHSYYVLNHASVPVITVPHDNSTLH